MIRLFSIMLVFQFLGCQVNAVESLGSSGNLVSLISELPRSTGYLLGDKGVINSTAFREIAASPEKYYQEAVSLLKDEKRPSQVKLASTVVGLCLGPENFSEYINTVFELYRKNKLAADILESAVIVPFNYSDVIRSRSINFEVKKTYSEILSMNVSLRLNKYIEVFFKKDLDKLAHPNEVNVCSFN